MASVHQSALVLDQTSVTEWATQRVPLLDASLEPLKVKGWAQVLALALETELVRALVPAKVQL